MRPLVPAAPFTLTKGVCFRTNPSIERAKPRVMKFLSLIWSNLKRKKLRTILTLLSVFVAFVLYGLLCTIKEAFTAGVSMAGADRLIVRHKVSLIMNLPASYKDRIERLPGVDSAVHFTWFN